MLARFRQQLTQHQPEHHHFLIGLSGGVDSVVLLHLFAQIQAEFRLKLRAVHIHHGLSPNADDWAKFCQQLCEQHDIPLIVQKVKVEGKQGLEANARTARYQAIQQIIQPNEILATAHHLDDQAETFFLALKRGAGVKGLSGMQAVSYWQNFAIFRPLLSFSKSEILQYAQAIPLQWIEDESNFNTNFDRNFLRQQILPTLNQRWQSFNQMVARASFHCAEQQQLIEELLAEELYQRANFAEQRLNITKFEKFSLAKQQQLVRLWLEKCQQPMPSQQQMAQLIENVIFAETDKNPQLKLGDNIIRRYQQQIFITQAITEIPPFQQPINIGETLILPNELGTIHRNANELICKKTGKTDRLQLPTELQNQPLNIRLNYSGKVKLYGKPQREELKKIWQKNNVPVWERNRTPLLFFEDQLVMLLHTTNNVEQRAVENKKT